MRKTVLQGVMTDDRGDEEDTGGKLKRVRTRRYLRIRWFKRKFSYGWRANKINDSDILEILVS